MKTMRPQCKQLEKPLLAQLKCGTSIIVSLCCSFCTFPTALAFPLSVIALGNKHSILVQTLLECTSFTFGGIAIYLLQLYYLHCDRPSHIPDQQLLIAQAFVSKHHMHKHQPKLKAHRK